MIGNMRHRITFQERVLAADGGGGFTETWQDIASHPEVYAAIEPVSAGESFQSGQQATAETYRITIRHRTDITPDMRMTKGGAVYSISSVLDHDGMGAYLDILAVILKP